MMTVFLNAFHLGRIGLIWYVVAALMGVSAGGLGVSTLNGQFGESIGEVFQQLPPAVLVAFKINLSSVLSPVGYISARSLSLIVPLLLIAFAVGSAGSVSQLVERGMIHFELSLPIQRWQWLLGRILWALCGLGVILLVMTLALYGFASAAWWRYGVYGFAFGTFWLGLAYAIASIARERSTVTSTVFGFFAVQYLISIVAALNTQDDWLGRLSVWSAYQPEQMLQNEFPVLTVVLWCVLAMLGFGFALWHWHQRDLPA
jgi:ABC-type transport system involved in multi-copper enzyme maturation permease subunit